MTAIRRLAIARFISVAGSPAAYTALIDLVFRRTDGSPVALSLTILPEKPEESVVPVFEPMPRVE